MIQPIQPIQDGSRLWLVDGHEVDLSGPDFAYPGFVRAACLATREAQANGAGEDGDIAALCAWIIADHPPWGGGCTACRTAAMCPAQLGVHDAVLEWLFAQTLRRYREITAPAWQARLARLGAGHGA